jgi:hypothetical protein
VARGAGTGGGVPLTECVSRHEARKETAPGIPLKADAKDALGITDLAWQGKFIGFPLRTC